MNGSALGGAGSTTEASKTTTLTCDVFVNDPPSQKVSFRTAIPSRRSSSRTLIHPESDAVHTDPGMTEEQVRVLGDRVAGRRDGHHRVGFTLEDDVS